MSSAAHMPTSFKPTRDTQYIIQNLFRKTPPPNPPPSPPTLSFLLTPNCPSFRVEIRKGGGRGRRAQVYLSLQVKKRR